MFGSRIAYTVCMIAATLAAGLMLRRRQTGLSLAPVQKWGIAIGGLIGATFAAKVPFVLGADPTAGLMGAWLSDGKTILWGLAGGYLGVELAKWSFYVKTSTGDSFVIPVAVAVGIGRLGCLLFGCCYGVETDQTWGLRFVTAPDGGDLLRHPTQVYEMAFHFGFTLIAWQGMRKLANVGWAKGNWMLFYLISYAAYRFLSEYVRPELKMLAGLTFYQWSSLAIAAIFAVILVSRVYRRTPQTA